MIGVEEAGYVLGNIQQQMKLGPLLVCQYSFHRVKLRPLLVCMPCTPCIQFAGEQIELAYKDDENRDDCDDLVDCDVCDLDPVPSTK